VKGLFGTDNLYFKTLSELPSYFNSDHVYTDLQQGLGVLRGAQGEIQFGPLPRVEALISAEIFSDFLEMAEHLLENGYFAVVPALVGAVLEDGLRRMARTHNVSVRTNDNIAGLNSKLFDAKAINALARSKIELWNKIRNNADHGDFEANSEQDVRQMMEGVREFLALHLK
jgi:hypothetical protein